MKSSCLRGTSLLLVALFVALSGCKRETAPVPPDGTASNAGGELTIEYEILPSVLFEAESGLVTAPVALYDDAEASGGKYALAPEGPEHEEISFGGSVAYTITAPENGAYVLWLRAKWSGKCGDSLGILLDGRDLGEVGDAVHKQWHWVRLLLKTLTLTGGTHTLIVENREDGSAWDQVLLTRDEDYRPAGIETADVRGRTFLENTRPPGKPVTVGEHLPGLEAGSALQVIEVQADPPEPLRAAPVAKDATPVLRK